MGIDGVPKNTVLTGWDYQKDNVGKAWSVIDGVRIPQIVQG